MPPLVLVAAAWAAGLILARHVLAPTGVEPGALLIVASIPAAALVLYWHDRAMRLMAACSLALLAGAVRYEVAQPPWSDSRFVARYAGLGPVRLEGVLRSPPDVRDTWVNLRLAAETIEIGGRSYPVRGIVLVRTGRLPEFRYGDRLGVTGELEPPPELAGFDYAEYLARQGVYVVAERPRVEIVARGQGSALLAVLLAARERAAAAIARLVPEPEAALLQGILLGLNSRIPPHLYDQFNATGTSHVLVISGSNISLVVTLLWLGLGKLLGRRRAYWLTVVGIALYVAFVGGDAAVARAGLMGGLFVTALSLGRQATAYVSLCASGLLLTAIAPMALWTAGFQLSFGATLSLILFSPPLERWLERWLSRARWRQRITAPARALGQGLMLTLAAQVLTVPIVLYHFGRLSLLAPLSNLLILPVQPAIMIGGCIATVVAMIPFLAPVAQVLFWAPWLALAYSAAVVRFLAAWPLASVQAGPERAARLAAYYGVLLAVVWLASRGRVREAWRGLLARSGRRVTALLLGPPAVLALLLWIAACQQPDGRLHIVVLDVGEGDALLVTTPRGQQILVDGGPGPAALLAGLGRHMPFWDRSIDRVVMTHADADHLTGLAEVLRRYTVGGWWDSGGAPGQALYAECAGLVARKGVPYHALSAGDSIDLGEGARLDVLSPPPGGQDAGTGANDRSVVLRLVWGQTTALLMGDAGSEIESRLLQSSEPLAAQVLKVAHHGSDGSSSAAFLAAVAPRYAVVSVGAANHFGHPAPKVLERLATAGAAVLRTDQAGTLELMTDGQNWWLKTER